MRPEDLKEFISRQPFQPLRVTLTDGRTNDIVHPDLAMVGRSSMAIGLPRASESTHIYDRLVTVSILHIMQVEPVDTAPAESSH